MSQEQLDRMENMLQMLIKSVGSVMEEQTSMKGDICSIKKNQDSMKAENESRHEKVMEALDFVKADNELLWEKSNKNEREIGILKKLYKI